MTDKTKLQIKLAINLYNTMVTDNIYTLKDTKALMNKYNWLSCSDWFNIINTGIYYLNLFKPVSNNYPFKFSKNI